MNSVALLTLLFGILIAATITCGLFIRLRMAAGCAGVGLVSSIILVARGHAFEWLIGPFIVLMILPILLWIKKKAVHRRSAESLREQDSLKGRLIPLKQQRVKRRAEIHSQEEAIHRISELYGLSKRFLGTLEAGEALEAVDDVLRKQFPQISEEKRMDYLKKVKSLLDKGEISVGALLQLAPALPEETSVKEQWGIISGQCALGLQRISLYAQVQEAAIHDGLTGLLVRRYIFDRLREEVDRAARRKNTLAVLMVDLDYFKHVNDTYGHLVGDVVLREVASFIRGSVREMDLVGRYGGEEFSVILPEADRALGIQIADRIRQMVENNVVRAYDEKISVTVSVGVALYPEDAQTAEQLVEQADAAMYKAKTIGRNRTVSAQ